MQRPRSGAELTTIDCIILDILNFTGSVCMDNYLALVVWRGRKGIGRGRTGGRGIICILDDYLMMDVSAAMLTRRTMIDMRTCMGIDVTVIVGRRGMQRQ